MPQRKLRTLLIWALCCDFGLLSKRVIAPAANLITDSLHIPGGIGTGFSLMFLTLASMLAPGYGCCTFIGFVQSLIRLALGHVGSMGILSPMGYILPGLVMDASLHLLRNRIKDPIDLCTIVNMLGSVFAALAANLIVFRLSTAPLALYLCVAAFFGALFGNFAGRLLPRLRKALRMDSYTRHKED